MADRAMKNKLYMMSYDNDSCLGVNNEGKLVYGYSLEDTDYVSVDASGKQTPVYTGQDSVFWKLVSLAFPEELAEMYRYLRTNDIMSYEKQEALISAHQKKIPTALRNEDSWFSYILPYLEEGKDYLEALQGSKAEQRKWFEYHRYKDFDSKYLTGDAAANYISMRGYAVGGFEIIPYADIYINVKFGSRTVEVRAKRNQKYTIECPLDTMHDTEIAIYSGDQLASIGDFSALKADTVNVAAGIKLKDIIAGKRDENYVNANLKSLTTGNNVLVETIQASRCINLAGTINLSGSTGLKNVGLWDTRVANVRLPVGGVLETLDYPGSIVNLTIRDQKKLRSVTFGGVLETELGENNVEIAKLVNGKPVYKEATPYSGISTLRLENIPDGVLPITTMLAAMPDRARVRLVGFHFEMADTDEISDFFDVLDRFRGMDENEENTEKAQVICTIHIPSASGNAMAELEQRGYPYVTINADHTSADIYYDDENGVNQHKETVLDGGNGTWNGTIAKAATAQYTYTFAGWSKTQGSETVDATAQNAVKADRHLFPVYTKTVNNYTVTFKNVNGTVLKTQTVPYGGSATAPANPTHPTDPTNYTFLKWDKAFTNITGETVVTAIYKYANEDITNLIASVEAGTVATDYQIKDAITLNLGSTYGTVTAEIAGFGKDTLSDGSKAPVTLILGCQLKGTYRMGPNNNNNASGTGTVCEWSELENKIKTDIVPLLEGFFGENLGTAKKVNKRYNTSGSAVSYNVECKAFIPSYNEVYGSSDATGEPAYSAYFGSNDRRIRKQPGSSSGSWWWLRSAYGTNGFNIVASGGNYNNNRPESAGGVVLGFCLKKKA